MTTTIAQYPIDSLVEDLVDGTLIPFLGSGAHAGLDDSSLGPNGPDLSAELRSEIGEAYGVDKTENLAMVAQVFESVVFSRPKLYEYLHERLHVAVQDAPTPPLLRTILQLPPPDNFRFIVTTNYDSFIELAFGAAKRKLCVVRQNMRNASLGPRNLEVRFPSGDHSSEDAVNWSWSDDKRLPRGTTILYKIHGSVNQQSPADDDLIITEDDYVEFLVNAGGKTAAFFPPTSLGSAFSRRYFLFIGYSLNDWNLRAFLRALEVRSMLEVRHYALRRDPSELEVRLWERRKVELLTGTIEELCTRISSNLPQPESS
jgi:hypothetical protein